jgi:rhamnosyltransferase
MNPMAEATAAVVVVYRLQHDLQPVLSALRMAVGTLIVVDNSESGHAGLAERVEAQGATLILGHNRGGLAGAYNLALDHLRRQQPAPGWVVFLDEDSDPAVLPQFLADSNNRRLLSDAGTAAVAPAYRDRATGLRGKYIELHRLRLHYLSRTFDEVREVAFIINSMAVWRVEAIDRIGRFNEQLAIDHIDTDFCLRSRHAGLKVWVHGRYEFAHAIGERRRFRFLGKEMQAGGHGPRRRWLIGRNTVWLARREFWREPAFAFLCLSRLAYEVVGIVLAEPAAAAKLSALLRGALAGLFAGRLR